MTRTTTLSLTLLTALSLGGVAVFRGRLANAGPAAPGTHAQAAAAERPILAEGRMVTYPGRQVTIGTEVAGPLRRLTVTEKSVVKKGDVIAEVGVDEQRAALRETWARVGEAAVDVGFAGTELARAAALHNESALPKASLDKATRERDAAIARRDVARASAARLDTVLNKAVVRSPIDGVVLEKHAEQGELVAQGSRLVTVADITALRVEAEIDEFDGARVSLGQAVSVWAEGYPGRVRGEVEEIPDQVVSRRIKPQDPGRPTDTRVLAVKVKLLEPATLRLGQRVELELAPRRTPGSSTASPPGPSAGSGASSEPPKGQAK